MGFLDFITGKPSEKEIAQENTRRVEEKLKHSEKLNMELQAALEQEASKDKASRNRDRRQALEHLKVAERYEESMQSAPGARKSELKAIVDKRVENAANLGLKLRGSISETINRYS